MGWIYQIRNKNDGKCYVGQTRIEDYSKRWNQHRWSIKSERNRSAIKRALVCHGLEAFVFEIICEVPTENLNAREIQEIAQRNTIAPNGYNLKKGGDNHEVHEITRQKLREAQTGPKSSRWGKKNTPEHNQKIKEALTGKTKGPVSDDQKVRLRKSSPKAKRVNQYTLDGKFLKTWDSTKQAQTQSGESGVGEKCKGIRGGTKFLWTYYVEGQDPAVYVAPEKVKKTPTPEQKEHERELRVALRQKNREQINENKRKRRAIKKEVYKKKPATAEQNARRREYRKANRDHINAQKREYAKNRPRPPQTEEQKAKKREDYNRKKALKNNLVSDNKE